MAKPGVIAMQAPFDGDAIPPTAQSVDREEES
jgi:hypothetical protein